MAEMPLEEDDEDLDEGVDEEVLEEKDGGGRNKPACWRSQSIY
jgi:hypothetical protein